MLNSLSIDLENMGKDLLLLFAYCVQTQFTRFKSHFIMQMSLRQSSVKQLIRTAFFCAEGKTFQGKIIFLLIYKPIPDATIRKTGSDHLQQTGSVNS